MCSSEGVNSVVCRLHSGLSVQTADKAGKKGWMDAQNALALGKNKRSRQHWEQRSISAFMERGQLLWTCIWWEVCGLANGKSHDCCPSPSPGTCIVSPPSRTLSPGTLYQLLPPSIASALLVAWAQTSSALCCSRMMMMRWLWTLTSKGSCFKPPFPPFFLSLSLVPLPASYVFQITKPPWKPVLIHSFSLKRMGAERVTWPSFSSRTVTMKVCRNS